jgi:hypothetical protein
MVKVSVAITRWVSDEPQSGLVEFQFSDTDGRRWSFVDKSAICGTDYLDGQSPYPRPGVIACELVGRGRDAAGREVVQIDTERPWGIESVEDAMRFVVFAGCLVEGEDATVRG